MVVTKDDGEGQREALDADEFGGTRALRPRVSASKALRSLTSQEVEGLDPSTVARMRWVLTVKSDGAAKARLVILAFQMGNITELETAAPTMGRVRRYLLLSLCASWGCNISLSPGR